MAFPNAQNPHFDNCSFTDIGHDLNYYHTINNPEAGLQVLLNATSPGAAFDSQDRYPPAKCHPGTRKDLREEITSWIDKISREDEDRILWLHGPAGAGKSAVAQTIAEDCAQRNILAASFFFSRGRPGRDTIERLFATIAYQLAISIPSSQPHILRSLTANPRCPRR